MRAYLLPLLLLSAAAAVTSPAAAEPAQEAGSAMRACLAAVIDGAPVSSIKGQDVAIERDRKTDCTVQVTAGEPARIRQLVLAAVTERREGFLPAKTSWDPGRFASRETFCNLPGRRNLNVVMSTALPGAQGVTLLATVIEAKERDSRCDRDEGLQKPGLGG